jgi:hypothetical protein
MSLLVADRAPLRLPGFGRHPKITASSASIASRLAMRSLTRVILRINIQHHHLLSFTVMRLNVPVQRCHGSVARWSSVVAFRSGSTGAMVLNKN